MPDGALAGLRVLDLSNLFSGPSIAAILADFGADVVKVEPPDGDPLRFIGAQRAGKSLPWAMAGRNKRTIIVDPAHGDVLVRLTDVADVIVVNQPLRLLEQWRCTPEEIAARNPRAVLVWATAYGSTGPYADRPGNGTLGEAFGGLTHMIGEPDGPPVLPSAPLGDMLTAIVGALGALAACYWRDAGGGEGQVVDVSMFEPPLALLSTVVAGWLPTEDPPRRTGSRVPGGVPRNTYQAGDGRWVVLSGTTDAQVARILPIIGLDTDEGRARFAHSGPRLANGDELDALVAGWIAGHDTAEVLAAFLAARIPITEVNDLATLVADPHVKARGSVVSVPDPDIGDVLMPAPVPRLNRTPATINWTGRGLGADTDAVCHDWLGADEDDVAALRAIGAVS
jgi:crotonobetainyl-CoA:carnitine CoA-transferase CaiB-like acyl-CoA transferase